MAIEVCDLPRILVGSDINKGVNGRRCRSCGQALLGHASPDTVMIYAKLYPSLLIEECRKTGRSTYNAYYGEEGLKNPTAEEWTAFAASCNLRDMGTHVCALPTGEHCPKGLICLGCAHAQPKKSCAPQKPRQFVKWINAGWVLRAS